MGIADKNSTTEVLAQVPKALRALVEENTKLASELEEFRKRAKAEEIVTEMDEKGLTDPEIPFREKVAALLDSGKDLDLFKQAVEMATPNFNFAQVSDADSNEGDSFEDYILS